MSPVVVASVGLLALQASLLVLTTGIFVTTVISANGTLSMLRRTVDDLGKTVRIERLTAGAPDPIPARYLPARWRDMTPIDATTGEVGLGFLVNGKALFLRLPEADVTHIAEQFTAYRESRTTSQSPSESGGPKSEERKPEGTLKCTP